MVYRQNSKTTPKKYRAPRWRQPLVLVVIIGAVVAATLAGLAYTHTYPFERAPVITAGSNTKGEKPASQSGGSAGSSTSNSSSSNGGTYSSDNKTPASDSPSTPSGQKPLAPTGTFVSSHRNIPANASLASSCVTSSGATCQIIFTQDSITKTLPVQTTDAGGGTYWLSWKPQDIGLTAGPWHVQAKAVLGGQVVTADDAQTLDIAP